MDLNTAFVIGMGEVGRRLAAALEAVGTAVVPVTRTAGWDRAVGQQPGPRIVCVREDDLATVVERLLPAPPSTLVVVQNGWVRPVLTQCEGVTRGLVWFTSKGDFFKILRPTPLCGPWAGPLAHSLSSGGLPAIEVDEREFSRLEADKMGFNCVVGLPLAVHNLSLGELLDRHRDEARAVFSEAVNACTTASGVDAGPDWWTAFTRDCEDLGWVRVSRAKALDLRNRAVVALANAHGLEAPVNERLLRMNASSSL